MKSGALALPRLRLTKSAIDAIEPAAKDIIFWDPQLPGFGLKVTPKGSKVFLVQYRTRNEGRLRKYTIGRFGTVTPAQAREEGQRVLNERREGQDPAAEKRHEITRSRIELVDELLAEFIKRHVAKQRAARETVRIIERDILPKWNGRSIHSITKADVVCLIDGVIDRGALIMANRVFAIVRKFFNWCVGRAIIEASPCLGIQLPSVETQRDRILSDEELARVAIAADELGHPFGSIVRLLILTGQRRNEVAFMTWDEIDPASRIWTMSGERTKNGKPHTVHLSQHAIEVIEAAPQLGAFVFSTRGDVPYQAFSKSKRKLDAISGVSDWVLHDLRRTVVSGMARLGAAPHVADKILNHQRGTISGVAAIYQRYEFEAERRQALDLWGAHVGNLSAGTVSDNVIPLIANRSA